MTFEKQLLPYADTKSFSDLVIAYLNGDEKLKPFYSYPLSIQGLTDALEKRKSFQVDRKTLVEVLHAQNTSSNEKVKNNIELLLSENTFTITTGHQLNIFTGPLYFVYKIFSAINLAEQLNKQFTKYSFIPVYWMASEDHDFAEINHIHVFDKTITWSQDEKGASGNISAASIFTALEELKTVLGESENAKKLFSLFETAYQQNKNLSDATRHLVGELFGKYGLVIIDASERKLKKLFTPVIKNELLNQFSFKNVNTTTIALNKLYKSQVTPREVNLFYTQKNFRERIEILNSEYRILNSELTFSENEILNELENHPENFSPNVVLRPLYQELILPNLAYIGGGAEINYWLQYKAMFESQNVFFPVLVLRNSVMVLDFQQTKKFYDFGFQTSDMFNTYDDLVKSYLKKMPDAELNLNVEAAVIEKTFESITSKISVIDPTLSAAVNAEKQKALNALKVLEDKSIKALKRKSEISLNQIKLIKDKLFPQSSLQERYFNYSMFYLKYGDAFFDALKDSLNPLEKEFIVLFEKE